MPCQHVQDKKKSTVPAAQWLSIALAAQKFVGSIPREHCKSLWIKASAKCINVNTGCFAPELLFKDKCYFHNLTTCSTAQTM